jgi:hypothetical protein
MVSFIQHNALELFGGFAAYWLHHARHRLFTAISRRWGR